MVNNLLIILIIGAVMGSALAWLIYGSSAEFWEEPNNAKRGKEN